MWRNTGLVPKFFIFDIRSFLFFLPFLMHISYETFYLGIFAIIVFGILNFYKISFGASFLALRRLIIGGVRPAKYENFRKRMNYNRY